MEVPVSTSLIVWPFVNLTGDPHNNVLVDGITEQLAAELARIDDSLVVNPNPAVARFVIKGNVRVAAAGFRVNAQLIDSTNDQPLRVERCDLADDDLLSMQQEAVARLAPPLHAYLLSA